MLILNVLIKLLDLNGNYLENDTREGIPKTNELIAPRHTSLDS
jgi:hypothetical protein